MNSCANCEHCSRVPTTIVRTPFYPYAAAYGHCNAKNSMFAIEWRNREHQVCDFWTPKCNGYDANLFDLITQEEDVL